MALTSIEPVGSYSYRRPPVVPARVPKSEGFNFLPPGTGRLHDGGKWGLYYCPDANISYIVTDYETFWRTVPVPGKLRVGYAKGVMATKPCCQED